MAHSKSDRLDPERVAYWYFRLNGFFQIENFVVHPERRGSQRTDADLLAVRFPFRAERLFDNPNDVMADDQQGLKLSPDLIDAVIAEVKTNQPCTLNGPWTKQEHQNVHRALAAMGCIPADHIKQAAEDIYRAGAHVSTNGVRIRLIAVGRENNNELFNAYPNVVQRTWRDVLSFIWNRLRRYRQQKTQVDQWDCQGRRIKRLADTSTDIEQFVVRALQLMGVTDDHSPDQHSGQ